MERHFLKSRSMASTLLLLYILRANTSTEDVIASPASASVVTKINGIDAATYVGNWIYQASFNQDADAAYNSMFYKKAFTAGGDGNGYFASGGRAR